MRSFWTMKLITALKQLESPPWFHAVSLRHSERLLDADHGTGAL